jgi:hypothetical protein
LQLPLDPRVKTLADLPYTISFVIRKKQQVDNLMEIPKDKRPVDELIWEGTSEDLEEWIDKVFDRKEHQTAELIISEVEG